MRRAPAVCLLLVAACSKGPQADLPSIGEARSLAAEWALVNEQAGQGKLTETYTARCARALRQQLQTDAKSLTAASQPLWPRDPGVARGARDAPPANLRAHAAA